MLNFRMSTENVITCKRNEHAHSVFTPIVAVVTIGVNTVHLYSTGSEVRKNVYTVCQCFSNINH